MQKKDITHSQQILIVVIFENSVVHVLALLHLLRVAGSLLRSYAHAELLKVADTAWVLSV